MMELGIVETLISLAAIFLVFYTYASWNYGYWKKLGVPGPKPTVPFGNLAAIFLRRKPLVTRLQEIYNYSESVPYVGYFIGTEPILLLKDPDLIKNVLIKDFNVFSTRGIQVNEKVEPLTAHLFNIEGVRWKALRSKLTPIFSTGKIRQMFYLMAECADNFGCHMKHRVMKNNVIECREEAARYTTDVIGSCAFGIDTQALEDENSDFRKYGKKIFEPGFGIQMKRLMREITPRLYELLDLSVVTPDVTKFFLNTMKETVESRKRTKSLRNDFVDLLLQIPNNLNDDFELTDNLLAAQAFVFFAAGFEASSTSIAFALSELAQAPELQEKLRSEIMKSYEKNEGKITYDSVNDMRYLDMVMRETLRKNPPLTLLVRKAVQNYTIPGTNVTIPSGQRVQIPIYSLQLDPKNYPKPDVFDPERFNDKAKQSRHSMLFLPFGDGPRNCIGARFAYYQMKLGLIIILKNFRVQPITNDNGSFVIEKESLVLSPVDGFLLKFEPL